VKTDLAIKDLEKLQNERGLFEQQLDEDIDSQRKTFKGHSITWCTDVETQSVRSKFLKQLLENMHQR
jgi:hypothetical protein